MKYVVRIALVPVNSTTGMYGNTRIAGRGKSEYSSYRCSNKTQCQGCLNKELRKEYLENYALDQLYERLFSDNSIKKLSAMLNDYNNKKTLENNGELTIYQKQLAEINKKITSVINLVSESQISINTVKDNLKQLEADKNFYEIQIKSVRDTMKMSVINEDVINSLIEKSRDFIRGKNIPQYRNFIENYIERVLVWHDKVEIIFRINIPSENSDAEVVPLTSEAVIKTIQREYRDTAKLN